MDPTQDIAKAVVQLQALLTSRENSLKEREDALDRRLKLFEEQFPQAGKDADVLHLNVGGSTNIAVLRRTLTHFENSMLASRFSGRWDDSLEKDKDGNFFIDQDPAIFLPLLNYLRLCDQKKRSDVKIPPPAPTFEFCSMLEYYDLMSSVYPQAWQTIWVDNDNLASITQERLDDDSVTIYTGTIKAAFTLEVADNCPTKPVNATSFTVVFDRGSEGQVGWAHDLVAGRVLGSSANEFALDMEQRVFMSDGSPMIVQGTTEQVNVSSRENPVTVVCSYDRLTETYSIRVDGDDPMIVATRENQNRMIPCICLVGQVKISSLSYQF